MIKLRQINHSAAFVAQDMQDGSPCMKKEYSLTDVWVNPRAILYFQVDEELAEENKHDPLINGLDREHVFTKIFISENGFARQIVVIGDPASVNREIEGSANHGR